MLYIIYQEDGPGSKELREIHKPAHFAYLEEHKDILVLAGPCWPRKTRPASAAC